jgi:hypothetical protein
MNGSIAGSVKDVVAATLELGPVGLSEDEVIEFMVFISVGFLISPLSTRQNNFSRARRHSKLLGAILWVGSNCILTQTNSLPIPGSG